MTKGERDAVAVLAQARTLADAQKFVEALEQQFGYSWRPVGDNEANYGVINLGSDPGHALIERVTNAIDAVIERESLRQRSKKPGGLVPASPREAVDAWFAVPGGRVANLGDPAKRQPLADKVIIQLLEGSSKREPTVVVRDLGVGLTCRSLADRATRQLAPFTHPPGFHGTSTSGAGCARRP